jgi:hypothetical protein
LVAAVASLALAAPAGAAGTVTMTSLSQVSAVEGNPAGEQAAFTDTNALAASGFTVTINWGDGTAPDTTSAIITQVATTYGVSATHTFAEEGFYNVSMTVTETVSPANTDTKSTTAVADDAPLAAAFGTPTSFSGGGSSAAPASLAAFEAAIGGTNNGSTPAEQSGGFRRITWDGIAFDGSDPGSTVISPGHVVALSRTRVQSAGIVLTGPTAVANDGFTSVNPNVTSPLRFPAFSAPDIVAPFNGNPLALSVVTPAGASSTPTGQATRGLGLMFLNVRNPGATTVDYYNGNTKLYSASAPVTASPGLPSFVGELFGTAVVTRVVVTMGTAQIFSFDGTTSRAGPADSPPSSNLVAADDVVLAEPAAPNPNIAATAGAPFSGVVNSFIDTDPNGTAHDYSAVVDWGDGSRSSGTIAAGSAGNFTVSGSHTYAQPGGYVVGVTVDDFGGAQHRAEFTALVSQRSTASSAACKPASVGVLLSTTCTATVSDTQAGAASAPTGTVVFTSDSHGGFAAGSCSLSSTATAGQSSCSASYVPDAAGSGTHRISAAYGGDAVHSASGSSTTVTVTAGPASTVTPKCSMTVPSATLGKHAKRLAVDVSCSAPANVRVTAIAVVKPRHGRHSTRLPFAARSTTVRARERKTLKLSPSPKTLRMLRGAAREHAKISLALGLQAVNTAAQSTARKSVPISIS